MMTKITSRKDDLISLCFLLVYLIDHRLHILDCAQTYEDILIQKKDLSPHKLCISDNAQILIPFVEEVFKIGFSETPEYEKL